MAEADLCDWTTNSAFMMHFLNHIEKFRKQGKKVIFCGDINTAHEEIDLARPKENEENTGFLPEERAWLDEVVNSGYVDTFDISTLLKQEHIHIGILKVPHEIVMLAGALITFLFLLIS
jgi:exonuclease III